MQFLHCINNEYERSVLLHKFNTTYDYEASSDLENRNDILTTNQKA
jgi:hypothetical protein